MFLLGFLTGAQMAMFLTDNLDHVKHVSYNCSQCLCQHKENQTKITVIETELFFNLLVDATENYRHLSVLLIP